MSLLEQVQSDTKDAMRAGDRDRVAALRLIVNELQKAHKDADGSESDEVAVLQRERKRRVEAAEAYREAGRDLMALADQVGELAHDGLGRADLVVAAVDCQHVPAQVDVCVEVALERLHHDVPGPRELGGDFVGKLEATTGH